MKFPNMVYVFFPGDFMYLSICRLFCLAVFESYFTIQRGPNFYRQSKLSLTNNQLFACIENNVL